MPASLWEFFKNNSARCFLIISYKWKKTLKATRRHTVKLACRLAQWDWVPLKWCVFLNEYPFQWHSVQAMIKKQKGAKHNDLGVSSGIKKDIWCQGLWQSVLSFLDTNQHRWLHESSMIIILFHGVGYVPLRNIDRLSGDISLAASHT